MTQILRNFTAFVDGYDTRLSVAEITPPLVRDAVEEMKSGGLLAPMDVPLGLQKLEAGLKINARIRPLMRQVGMTPGKFVRPTFRGVSISEIDGSQQNETLVMQGRLNIDANTWAAQGASQMDFKIGSITYFKHVVDGSTLYEIDLINFVCIVDGTDQWADIRSGLGY